MSDRSFVPHPRLRRRRRIRSLLEDGQSTLRLISHRGPTLGDLQLVLSTFSQAFDHSCIVHSRIVHPCNMVPYCPLLQCPPLRHRANVSTPALSNPAIWYRIVHSCIFHTPVFDRAALSTPANSISPRIVMMSDSR